MKTKIGTSFGLALLLALGVIGAMLALGMFSSPRVQADHAGTGLVSSTLPAGHTLDVNVTGVVLSPSTPGSNANVQITFTMPGEEVANTLIGGSGQIVVTFDANFGLPATIAKERIAITTGQTTGGISNPAVDPSITTDPTTGDKSVIITVGDTDPATAGVQSLRPQGTSGAPGHILVFSPLAGITNPVVPSNAASLTNWIDVRTTSQGIEARAANNVNAVVINPLITLSSTSGANGTVITITGTGFTSGGTATVYLDSNDAAATRYATAGAANNQIRDGLEPDVATSAAAIAGGAFTATVTVSTTQFAVGANRINAQDGTGASAAASPTWTLIGSVTTDKASVRRGETVQVRLRQFATVGAAITNITFGGVPATVAAGTVIAAGNLANIDITVPTTTPLGTQRISVTGGGEAAARTVNIEVVGAPLTLSPSTAVPEQDITVSGSGFTGATNIATMFIGGFRIPAASIASNTVVTTDNSGNMVASVRIPISAADATTRTAAAYTLLVTDNAGRTGQATLTIPSRAVTVSPTSSRRGSDITITGAGFPSRSTVTIVYTDNNVAPAVATTLGSVNPDSVGGFTATFAVPTNATIPSATPNTITATSAGAGTPNATGSHSVPAAAVTVAEASASPGSRITVSGTGFPGFATMTVLNIGTVPALPSPAPASDGNGAFSATALVPQLAVGTHAVSVTVGGIVGTSSISIVAAPVVPPAPVVQTPATVFATEIAADTLVRVFRFDNATKQWGLFDPRPAFAAANTYTAASGGHVVWVNFKVDTVFQGTSYTAGWNLLVLR